MKFCPRSAPLTGYEPRYEPERWNTKKEIRSTHNCYSYAMNVMDKRQIEACLKDKHCNVPFHQPGSLSGYPGFNDKDPKTCPNMIARLLGDNPVFKPSSFELRCPRGYSKIALVVDEDEDYHFLRQDKPDPNDPRKIGYFSHKPGGQNVVNTDANKNKIFDVQLANLNYNRPNDDNLNYDRFCGYFCIPRQMKFFMKTGGRRYIRTRRNSRRRVKRITRRH